MLALALLFRKAVDGGNVVLFRADDRNRLAVCVALLRRGKDRLHHGHAVGQLDLLINQRAGPCGLVAAGGRLRSGGKGGVFNDDADCAAFKLAVLGIGVNVGKRNGNIRIRLGPGLFDLRKDGVLRISREPRRAVIGQVSFGRICLNLVRVEESDRFGVARNLIDAEGPSVAVCGG